MNDFRHGWTYECTDSTSRSEWPIGRETKKWNHNFLLQIPGFVEKIKKCVVFETSVFSTLGQNFRIFSEQARSAGSLGNLQGERTFQTSEKTPNDRSTHFIDLIILLNPISRLGRICVCFTSPFNQVQVSFDHFNAFYSSNMIFILNPLKAIGRIRAL